MSPGAIAGQPLPANATGSWMPGPSQPVLSDGDVHLWRADLRTLSESLVELLVRAEHERAAQIMRKLDGRLWGRSRGLLRALLGRYLQRHGGHVRIGVNEYGKPELLGGAQGQREPLRFSLSHSRHILLLAFTHSGPVGVDVQLPREQGARKGPAYPALARRALGAWEAERLAELPPSLRENEFLRAWTRHEAETKRDGVGIGAASGTYCDKGWVVNLDPGFQAVAALALPRAPRQVLHWDWLA